MPEKSWHCYSVELKEILIYVDTPNMQDRRKYVWIIKQPG
jgi:hypothetical protein